MNERLKERMIERDPHQGFFEPGSVEDRMGKTAETPAKQDIASPAQLSQSRPPEILADQGGHDTSKEARRNVRRE